MSKIHVKQDQGYGKWEFDLLNDSGEYVGLMIGTETREGKIWEIRRFHNGDFDGSIMRLPVMTMLEATANARIFCL